jgi:hypothetical protein
MAIESKGFGPSRQKKNPKGKYNEKTWVKLGQRDLVDIDEAYMLIYNNMDITPMYERMDSFYNTENRKPGSGNKKTNPEQ